jgi:pimeloyl-ACP methyl ester carboxylesterase/thiol-disulfide isomerase/thioredoxin
MKRKTFAVSLVLAAALARPGTPATGPAIGTPWSDTSPHKSLYADVNGIRLHYLDWGGSGAPLVMIHGIGDEPHIFDEVASRLRDRFRIVAYARRGHGLSDAPDGPYDPDTLVEDLRQLMDRLEIRRASLLGWSMGGNEITSFAGKYPERVDRLVYFDSGYDWSTPAFLKPFEEMLGAVAPGASDLKSLDTYRDWFRACWLGKAPWSPGLEAYIRDIAQPDARGVLHPVPGEKAFVASLEAVGRWPRDYKKVRAPVLSLYAPVFFPAEHGDPALARRMQDFEKNTMVPFRSASIERLRREVRTVVVKEIAGQTHMSIGVDQPDALAATIRGFLAPDLVRFVRNKISAGDVASGVALVEDYKRTTGVDDEYLNAIGWLARGAEMLKRPEIADVYVAELRHEIPKETEAQLIPYGAAIEVEGRLIATREGRGAGMRYFNEELARAKDTALRSRIAKNINLLSLEGQPAPPIGTKDVIGKRPPGLASLKGKPVLLFLWANWCGDCKAQGDSLSRIWARYRDQGLVLIAPTRYYGTVGEKPATPAEEKAQVAKVWKESYHGLEAVPVVIDTEAMVRYGVSATPTFVLIDRKGIVRLYAPTRLSEAELSRRIETLLAEGP